MQPMRNFDNYCPVSADTYAYLDREDQEPDTDPELDSLEETPEGQGLTRDHYEALVARSPLLQQVEGARAAHKVLGRIAL
jgi:hypothetical protein